VADAKPLPIDAVPTPQRIGALIVIYLIVIVFWMVFHQNGSTLTYWANENTRWNVTGIISNAINPMWVVLLTFPLVAVWRALDRRGREPSTPVKMLFGMLATSLAFLVMFLAARHGEGLAAPGDIYGYKVSPVWLVGAYAVLTLGELMLSPMGLALVSKVAPRHLRGIMMGGWFVATAIGNKLTQIGQLWDDMPHSSFWLLLSGCALFMAFVLMLLLKPLKKAMPGCRSLPKGPDDATGATHAAPVAHSSPQGGVLQSQRRNRRYKPGPDRRGDHEPERVPLAVAQSYSGSLKFMP
jgi:POT family proton-dependent oligopeptide transporter